MCWLMMCQTLSEGTGTESLGDNNRDNLSGGGLSKDQVLEMISSSLSFF